LSWDSNNIGLKGIKYIVEGIQSSKRLKCLSLKNTNIGNNGVKILAEGLRGNKSLEVLDLSSNSITYESFIEICESLNTNLIKTFKAKNNLLGDESMKYFSKTIISPDSTSKLNYFDFSSSKIYDQGLIYILSELAKNSKISKVKLRDNYFSHEIDYVVIDFVEKNTNLTLLDLNKNRFSFQCLQKLQKIIERNSKIKNDKEPNKLLVEVYRLKYENTKLNELKDALKGIENDVEKIKLNRADIRQDYENFKIKCEQEYEDLNKKNDKSNYILGLKEKELHIKVDQLETTKKSNAENIEQMMAKLNELKERKNKIDQENEIIAQRTDEMETEYIAKIEKLNNTIAENKRKEEEYTKNAKSVMEEIIKFDKAIREKEKERTMNTKESVDKK
jgi:hypothetical protein